MRFFVHHRTGVPHRRRRDLWTSSLAILGGLSVLFVLLPLAAIVLGTRPAALLDALSDREVLRAVALTFCAGALATLVALLTGVPLAYLLARKRFAGKPLVEGIIRLPVVIPHTAAGVALLLVFGRQGLLGRLLGVLGMCFVDRIPGIVVAMLFVSMPFLVSAAREAFEAVDPDLERVAETLGASRWQAFVYVTLPLAWRGILSGALMMWGRGISEFGAVAILAYHPKTVPVLVYERFAGLGLNAAQPVALFLILATLMVFIPLQALLAPRHHS